VFSLSVRLRDTYTERTHFFCAEVPLSEIIRSVVLPAMLQLEHGISLIDHNKQRSQYVGSPHVWIGDHVELCQVGGMTSGAYLFSSELFLTS
jgi:hypothetical protein